MQVQGFISVGLAVLSWFGIDAAYVGEKLGLVEPAPMCGGSCHVPEPVIVEPEPVVSVRVVDAVGEGATIKMHSDGTLESVQGGVALLGTWTREGDEVTMSVPGFSDTRARVVEQAPGLIVVELVEGDLTAPARLRGP